MLRLVLAAALLQSSIGRLVYEPQADFYGADLYGADFYGVDLSGVNLTGANLTDVVGLKVTA